MRANPEAAAADLAHVIVPWPDGVAKATGMSAMTLQRARAAGDAPKLYAVSERNLVTTGADLLEWIRAKAVPPGYRCRPPVKRGARREQEVA